MKLDEMTLVSVDDHIIEPPTVFERHLPKRWAERAPRLVYDRAAGLQSWKWEYGASVSTFINAVVTLPREEWGFDPSTMAEIRPACYDARLACFICDHSGLLLRDRIGVDNIAYEVDYPHSDCTFPHSPEELWEHFELARCSEDEIRKISHGNALRWFRFDPFRYVDRAEATVGGLRARSRDVDLRTRSKSEYKAAYEAAHGAVG